MRSLGLVMAAAVICLPGMTAEASGERTIFRPSTGLWAIQGVTRFYFGGLGDAPVLGDYTGDRVDDPAIFRDSSGLWAIRGVTRVYFGTVGDEPKPGDYTGDGKLDIAIFRPPSGLWAIRGVTRMYFGRSGDVAVAPVPKGAGLLKTGQTTSYYAGDDGAYQKGTAFSYQTSEPVAGEIVTTDNVTGLMWASDGSAAGCYNGGTRTWTQALDWANALTFAGYSDWRLPNRRELESIVDSSTYSHSINTTYFPNTVSGYWWSGSTYADDTTGAWFVGFGDGYVDVNGKTNAGYVRAVRGGE